MEVCRWKDTTVAEALQQILEISGLTVLLHTHQHIQLHLFKTRKCSSRRVQVLTEHLRNYLYSVIQSFRGREELLAIKSTLSKGKLKGLSERVSAGSRIGSTNGSNYIFSSLFSFFSIFRLFISSSFCFAILLLDNTEF